MSMESAIDAMQHEGKRCVHFSTFVILRTWNYTVYVIIICTHTTKTPWNTHIYTETTVMCCNFHVMFIYLYFNIICWGREELLAVIDLFIWRFQQLL